jgi:general secretion pathway protein G
MKNAKKLKSKKDEGWTFIETLIVMAIVLILTAAVGFNAVKQLDKAKIVTAKSQIETFSLALDSYYMDNGMYPSQEQGLNALWEKPSSSPEPAGWNGPYLTKPVPKDPWGNEYQYTVPGNNGLPYGVMSYGKDGTEGGENNDADITSWK